MALFTRLLERRDTTFQQVWGADLDNPASPYFGFSPTRDKVLGLSAVFACVRLLADTVSTLPLHAYEKRGTSRVEVDPAPEWLDRPVPRDPSITRVVHFQQVISSLVLDGNAFILVAPDVYRPAELRVLDPRTVEIKRAEGGAVKYEVRDYRGGVVDTFDWTQVIHIPLIRLAGDLRGISPLEAERQLFSGALATEELGARFARTGMWLSAMVEMPPTAPAMDEKQAEDLVRQIEAKYSGSKNAGKVGILTGGATLKQLSVTPEQAQFLETMQYSDERIFRIYRCPPALVGMVKEGAVSYASAVAQALAFEKHTIRPLIESIEPAYAVLAGPGRYLRFNTKGLLRADPLTQSQIYHNQLSDQYLLKEEVRAYEDLPADDLITGLLETPNNNPPQKGLAV